MTANPSQGTDDLPSSNRSDERALELAQQGYTSAEIADATGRGASEVDAAVGRLVPGGLLAVRRAMRARLRAWQRESGDSTWLGAEDAFGIPHSNITRLVRAPEPDIDATTERAGAGYLDAVLTGGEDIPERARICARAYAMGATLQEMGDRFGVTRERIRQVLSRETPWSSTEISAHNRRLKAARAREHARAVETWSQENLAAPPSAATAVLGMSEREILGHLGRRRTRHVPNAPRDFSEHRRSDDEILEDIRAYVRETGRTTAAGFASWARDNEVTGTQTAAIRFGSWNSALTAAGVENRAPLARERRFNEDDLWAALVAAVEGSQDGATARDVEQWLSRHKAAPSIALIRHRLGVSWSEMHQEALEIIRGTSERDPAWIVRITAARDWTAEPPKPDDLQPVREAIADLGTDFSSQAYTQWAAANGRPSLGTLMRRSGLGWPDLLERAGGVRRPPRRGWHAREAPTS
ncbi:homing endonuclease associated repeat-containing protein [Brachybacterium huguangmaarense]